MKLVVGLAPPASTKPTLSKRPTTTTQGNVTLYARPRSVQTMTAGAAMLDRVRRAGLDPSALAWDFASIALATVVADFAGRRADSPDGWTREFELSVPVSDPDVWNAQSDSLRKALSFLTTDRWHFAFTTGTVPFIRPKGKRLVRPDSDCVALLSGGLDSLVGGIDLVEAGRVPYFVSQVVPGDRAKQALFAARLGSELLALNHNVVTGEAKERSQRARSCVFIAYGVLAATSLQAHAEGETINLYVNENGYISINPP